MRKASFVKWGMLLLLSVPGFQMQAQSDSLSKDPARFFNQLSVILLNTKSPVYQAKASRLLAQFGSRWNNNHFTAKQQDNVRKVVELMRSKRLRTYPYLYDYLYSINLLAVTTRKNPEFTAWQRYAAEMLQQRRLRAFLNFLSFTENLLEKHLLYGKTTYSWHFRHADFNLHYDTVFSVRFAHLNLTKASRNDSTMIMRTAGVFIYKSKLWLGENGELKWNRFNSGVEESYKIADSYHFHLNTNIFRIDSVRLSYPAFLRRQAVLGRLTDRVLTGKPGANSVYPRFISYDNELYLPEIYPQISFHGGIELEGKRFYGTTVNGIRPEVIFSRNRKPVFKLRSRRFEFNKDKIVSMNVDASLLIGKDSIFHPQLQMRYEVAAKKLLLYNISDNSQQIPFFDSYHKMDLYVPSLLWNLKTDTIVFKKIRGVNDKQPARFESNRYFDVREFYALQGIDEINPLYVVQNFINTYSTKRISVAALSSFMNKPSEQVEDLLMSLSNKGFVVYDSGTKTALATKRLQYFLDAKAGRTDYDVIHFNSEEKLKPNASLNLKDFSLNIYGVPRIFISDSQQVYIYPYHKKIAVQKNRDFTFSGKVSVGMFNFYARKSTFVYDSFMINMDYIDSLSFGVWEKDTIRNRRYIVPVRQSLQKLNGRLYVDLPFNKSGLMHVPKYPEFVSESESYVYYNSRHIQDSTLLPGKFYYRISPFVFDSIMTFNTDHLAFRGSLVSGNIFKPIIQPLRVMPDHSLGFVYKTPGDGLSVYSGKGRYSDTLILNMQGFHGSGTLHYLTTAMHSGDFRFFPDSVLAARAVKFRGETDSVDYHFPSVYCDTVEIAWNTKKNVMQAISRGPEFRLYGNATLRGELTLSPDRFSGKGSFAFGHSSLSSQQFLFTNRGLDADSANFVLKNPDTGDTTFLARNYRTKIDFKARKGWFNHLDNHSYLEFPFNRFISTLDEVKWIMTEDKLSLYSTQDNTYHALDSLSRKQLIAYHKPGPEFISISPGEDSLRFYAGKAYYNINQYTIDVQGVKLIKAADAAIFPDKETVTILQKGKLATLENATILIDTANLFHNIYDARVDIFSRKKYTASGKLDYKDMNATLQAIKMDDVHVDANGRSIATGEIPKSEIFFLSPEYFFTGKVIMHAGNRMLHFSGGYQLNEDCVDNTGNWMAVDQDLDPNHIAFRFDGHAKTADSLQAWFGLAYSFQYHQYYPLVLQALRSPSDEVLISATGSLGIDSKTGSFLMGSPERLKNNDLKANFVELKTNSCQMAGDGVFNLGIENNMLKTKFIGKFKYLVVPDSTLLHVVMMMKFHFDQSALDVMADSLRMIPAKSVDITKGLYPMALKKLLNDKRAQNIINALSLYGQVKKLPDVLKSTISFTDLHLVWDPLSRSFISYGPIGIGSIGGNMLNKYMDGIMQIRKGRSGATIEFMLRHGKHQWYYFNYASGIMQVLSSDNNFNDIIENLKEDKRVLNPNSVKNYYEYVLTTRSRVVNFLRLMKRLGRLK